MNALRFTVAFFRVVPPVTRPIRTCIWTTVAIGAPAIGLFESVRAEAALTPLLVLQIFAASSGFSSAARRGHYDLLFCRGIPRGCVAAAHWIASARPGVLAWLTFAVAESVISPRANVALSSGSLVALGLASSVPWAITTALPRFGAAIGWLMMLVTTMAVVPSGQAALIASLRDPAPGALGALALVTYPMGAIGVDASSLAVATVAPALGAAALATGLAVAWHASADAPLESPS